VQKVLGLLVVLGIATIILTAVLPHDWVGATLPMAFTDAVTGIGTLLFTDYLILFEIASVLLLGALIGAATLARKEL
jgi:NADH:ubiquinone oxidoreductase subunit 6 (subunit J)